MAIRKVRDYRSTRKYAAFYQFFKYWRKVPRCPCCRLFFVFDLSRVRGTYWWNQWWTGKFRIYQIKGVIWGQILRSWRRDQKIVRSFKFILWYKFFAHEKPFAFSSSESLPIMLKGIITHLSSHLYKEYSSVIGQFTRQGL